MLSRSLALISTVTMLLAACASPSSVGSLSDYWGVAYTNVSTRCGGGYQVFRRPGESRILVRAYEISEARQSFCENYNGIEPNLSITGVRHEEAALEYLAGNASLKDCKLVSGAEITALHSEFILACPIAPDTAITAKG